MGTESLIAVADTGPLIHLAEIDSLELLTQFDALHIPYAVLSETTGKAAGLPDAISSLPNLQKHAISQQSVMNYVRSMQLDSLHLGEQHSLYLCHRIGISTLLTDDLAVRRIAKKLGLIPVGTLVHEGLS